MSKILMCAENMNGYKLEELLLLLIEEIDDKSLNIAKLGLPQAITTVANNNKIVDILLEARSLQIDTMRVHDSLRKNS